MKMNWSNLRIPANLMERLRSYGKTLIDQLDFQQQGNHEDPRSLEPPLWRTIELLLERDADHRRRSRKNTRGKQVKERFNSEGGIICGSSETNAAE